ncbi:S8 family peptidase [uncultured Dokdonia sp.]|uniref:S8 family peptidase n=1 Tax=uncultured Dokdonia sp. TaxID=575653 RepID=UPI002618C5CF|nr:S8 family peptidase [uncultured Dokdonia sp.]
MHTIYKKITLIITIASFTIGCDTPAPLVRVVEANIDSNPLKITPLSEAQEKSWGAKDLIHDTIPGMSVEKTYAEVLPGKSGVQTIVAVIDSGIDINHEDLKNAIWTNPKEIAGNGKDDDNNGYVDDIHGWNFLGNTETEQLELARIIDRYDDEFQGKTISQVPANKRTAFNTYQKARAERNKKYSELQYFKQDRTQILKDLKTPHEVISKKLGKEDYSLKELRAIQSPNEQTQNYIAFLSQIFQYEDTVAAFIKNIEGDLEQIEGQLNNYGLGVNYRSVVGDNPYDITDTSYGDNNVTGPKVEGASHGTHVGGIIAAQRNNGIGMNGVANNNIKLMVLRAVPDGDEYDKDIALAIRYAVDNGAKVINTSFGKYYAQYPEWVYEAIEYAAKKDVLIVNAAGNEGLNLDDASNRVYPNDQLDNTTEMSDTFMTIGALDDTYGSQMVASFSNYGKSNVDIFAPGEHIWSTTPNNNYEFKGGTSMAAPNVAGIAAMLRSYYPKLKASRIKQIIINSGLAATTSVIVAGDPTKRARFNELSKSGKIANMYNAFKLAELNK